MGMASISSAGNQLGACDALCGPPPSEAPVEPQRLHVPSSAHESVSFTEAPLLCPPLQEVDATRPKCLQIRTTASPPSLSRNLSRGGGSGSSSGSCNETVVCNDAGAGFAAGSKGTRRSHETGGGRGGGHAQADAMLAFIANESRRLSLLVTFEEGREDAEGQMSPLLPALCAALERFETILLENGVQPIEPKAGELFDEVIINDVSLTLTPIPPPYGTLQLLFPIHHTGACFSTLITRRCTRWRTARDDGGRSRHPPLAEPPLIGPPLTEPPQIFQPPSSFSASVAAGAERRAATAGLSVPWSSSRHPTSEMSRKQR